MMMKSQSDCCLSVLFTLPNLMSQSQEDAQMRSFGTSITGSCYDS